uniref:Uncharacterized protein n=1 Tax=Anguilla anguilla TaxID=7936 RepID=A0A0E9RMC7_ANGAN
MLCAEYCIIYLNYWLDYSINCRLLFIFNISNCSEKLQL